MVGTWLRQAVGMALRAIGKRRSSLSVAAISVTERLAASEVAAARPGLVALLSASFAAAPRPERLGEELIVTLPGGE